MANNVVFFDPSLKIESITPTLDDETFQFFLETYYEWMQTSNVEITELSGAFSNGETIVGQTTKASATLKQNGDNYIIVKMNTDTVFDIKETIEGQTSGNTAIVGSITDNIIRDISRLQANKDPRRAVGDYLEYLKNDLNRGISTESSFDRRQLISKVRDIFKGKSTEEAYKTLFRSIFDEIIELRYPGDDLLRVSDGNFQKRNTIRVNPDNTVAGSTLTIFDFLNKTIEGQTSGAVAVVSNIRISFLGGVRFADFTLRLISGEFAAGEELIDLLNPTTLKTTVFGVISSIDIVDGGTGYSVGDELVINGDGQEARATIASVDGSPITRLALTGNGIGYRIGTTAVIDNGETGGANLAIRVESIERPYPVSNGAYTVGEVTNVIIVNRGEDYFGVPSITLEDTTISALGLLHERLINIVSGGDLYEVGDTLVATGGTGSGAVGRVAAVTENFSVANFLIESIKDELIATYANSTFLGDFNSATILFEDGFGMLEEGEFIYYDRLKMEEWEGIGPIERIEFTDYGSGYSPTGLPSFTVTSANGVGANLVATGIQGQGASVTVDVANNAGGLGSIREILIVDQGINYSNATIDASGIGDGNANLTANVSGIFINPGFFADDDGKLNYKIIQDSLFYQDFSYVIRSGLSFTTYRDLVKQAIHPAGLEFFGEIVITSTIDASARFISEIETDAGTGPGSETVLPVPSFLSLFAIANPPPTFSTIHVDITPPKFEQPLSTDRQIEIEILPIKIDLGLEFSDVISKQVIQLFQIPVDVSAQIAVSEAGTPKSEFDIELAGAVVSINTDGELVEILGINVDSTINVISSEDARVQGPKEYNLFVNTSIVEISNRYEVEIVSFVQPQELTLLYGDVEIFQLKNESILSLSDIAFNTFFDAVSVSTPQITSRVDRIIELDLVDKTINVVASEDFEETKTFNLFANVGTNVITQLPEIEISVDDKTALSSIRIEEFANKQILEYSTSIFNDTISRTILNPVRGEINVEVPLYIDATMAFYSDIQTLESSIKEVELTVSLFQSIAPQTTSSFELDVIVPGKEYIIDTIVSELSGEVSQYATLTGNTLFTPKNAKLLSTANSDLLEIDIEPDVIDKRVTIAKASEDFPQFKTIAPQISVASANEKIYDIEIDAGGLDYADYAIESLAGQGISLYENETFDSKLALASAGFVNGKTTITYGNLNIMTFAQFTIGDYEEFQLAEVYRDNTIKKNVPIVGTVSTPDPSYAAVTLTQLASETINTYSANTFDDLSTIKIVVVGSNTTFDENFLVNDFIIIDDEKFIIQRIANSEYMYINVRASENYSDVTAYKEYFV